MRGVTSVIVQLHQILRLPRKMNLMIDPWHKWNVIYNARSNMRHSPNSPNTAPATKNESHHWSSSHMKRYLQCAEQQVSLSKLTKYCACHEKWPSRIQNLKEICWKRMKRHFQCAADPSMIRAWSENDPRMKPSVRNPPRNRGYLTRPPRAFCIEKYNISRSGYHSKFHRILRLPRKVTLELHQMLRLPRKMNLMIDPCHTWNAIYNARSNKSCHCPNSPNAAPATKNESHHWSSSHMKRYLQCAEQKVSLSKLTKYCACHEKWPSRISKKFAENGWNVISNARPIRAWSEHDPRMIRPWNRQSATRLATEVTFHAHHEHFVLKNTTFRAPAIIPNFTEYCACHEKWHSNFTKYCACHEKWISWSLSHMKRYLQCAEQQVSLSKLTKYCACHAKWISWLILDTNETLFTMRGATCVIVQTHQILRLPRKMTVQNLKEICWKRMKRHFQCAADPSMIRAWSDHETDSPQPASQPRLPFTPTTSILYWKIQHFALRLSFQISPNTAPATKSDDLNFTKYCACHEKWHLHFTKYCACHEKWHFNFTKYCACHENRAITWLSYYLTELWLDWRVTWLSYYLTELWLDWAMTWLSCDLTELWRDWAITELWLDWAMTWLSCDVTELWLDWAVTWLSCNLTGCDLTELWLDWAVTWLSCDVTELWRDWAVTWLSCDLTELWLDWAVTWLSCDLTELWLDWAVTWLSCDLTELWRDWAVTWLSCDLTELWLDWAVTWLSCDLTELWLDWAVTWLSCDLTELWLDWAVTWLNCDLTELWLDWAVTWLSCDLTELRCDVVRISEVSQPKLP